MRSCPGTRAETFPAVQTTRQYRVSSPCRSATLRRSSSTALRAEVGTATSGVDVISVSFCCKGLGWSCSQLTLACLQPMHDRVGSAAEVVVQLGVVGEELVVCLHIRRDRLVDGLV